MSYIEREAMMATVDEWVFSIEDFGCFVQALEQIPAADVVEVVHGEWVNVGHALVDTTGNCNKCGKQAVWRTINKPYIICPNCGAKMGGNTE